MMMMSMRSERRPDHRPNQGLTPVGPPPGQMMTAVPVGLSTAGL
jgi:hypothetical protein